MKINQDPRVRTGFHGRGRVQRIRHFDNYDGGNSNELFQTQYSWCKFSLSPIDQIVSPLLKAPMLISRSQNFRLPGGNPDQKQGNEED